jgi:L-aspartate oxidase
MIGVNSVLSVGVVYPPLPCRASPPQGGRSTSGDLPLNFRTARLKRCASLLPISPLEGEMPGRAEGGISCSKAATPC